MTEKKPNGLLFMFIFRKGVDWVVMMMVLVVVVVEDGRE